jgi:tetratricopeptide (TPR) repeat protein
MISNFGWSFFYSVVIVFLLLSPAFCDYSFEDNIKDYMAAGVSSFDSGKLLDAQIDFENILAMNPRHKGAILKLLDVLILRKEKGSATEVLMNIEKEKLASADEITTYREKLKKLQDKEPVRLAKALSADDDFQSSGKAAAGEDGSTNGLPGLDALDDDELSEDNETSEIDVMPDLEIPDVENSNVEKSGLKSSDAGKPLSTMSPAEQFKLALSLKKNAAPSLDRGSNKEQVDLLKSIRLFVSAIMADPGLLKESDEGLLALSKEHYQRLVVKEPENPKYNFLTAYFHDICSEHAMAIESYQKVASLAKDGSRLQAVARSKILSVERAMNVDKLANDASTQLAEDKQQDEFLDNVALGHHDEFTEAIEYADKAKEIYGKWTESKDDSMLDEAIAYYKGAICLDGTTAAFHYGLALVFIEKAAMGDFKSNEVAKFALDATLANSPSDSMKESAEKLLVSVSK